MTTKRSKGFASLDLVLPVAPHYRTDPQILKDVETMRTNAASRWAKDDYSQPLSNYHHASDSSSKISALARPKVEILRANSPTLKRLLAARAKLEKYSNTIARTLSASRQSVRSIRETPYPAFHDKQSSVVSQPTQVSTKPVPPPPPPPPPPPAKQIKCQTSLADGPVDKITYEKTWSRSGNVKQKCSLEIWLPKPGLDDCDDDDGDNNRRISSKRNSTEMNSHPISTVKSRRSSVVKITATSTITNIETKSLDTVVSKKPDSAVVPRVYHYGDYVMDLPDERPRSSKSVTTVKSDGAGSIKSLRRQQTRSHTRRQSVSTNHSEEILRFSTIEVSTSAKNLSVPTKPTSPSHEPNPESTKSTSPNRETKSIPKSANSAMITELMQKYSLIKKNHQELTQAKLQLEKPTTESKTNSKGHASSPRPPPIPESTSLISSDHHAFLGKKLLANDTSAVDPNNTNTKLLERRSTPRKASHSDIYPHLRIFSLANQRQHRQSSASAPNAALLPTVSGKKSEETLRTLQRSKTLDVVLDIPLPVKSTSRVLPSSDNSTSYPSHRPTNGTVDQAPSRTSRRSGQTLRSEQQKTDTSSQRSHQSSISTLAQFQQSNQRNLNRNYLVPE